MLTSETPRRVVARREAVDMLGVGLNTLDKLIASGALRSIRLGRRVLIPLDAIDEFLRGQADDARP